MLIISQLSCISLVTNMPKIWKDISDHAKFGIMILFSILILSAIYTAAILEMTSSLRHTTEKVLFFKATTTQAPIQNEYNISNLKYISSTCGSLMVWHNFGYCDDITNSEACNFDNGDCCLPIIKTDHCHKCFCHETNTTHLGYKTYVHGKCNETLKSNGVCEDQINYFDCGYDMYDCCKAKIHCASNSKECICHLDGERHQDLVSENCTSLELIGDLICNDELNNEDCLFDGHDCCLGIINDQFCLDCICHLDELKHEVYCLPSKVGDNICHDECNTDDFGKDYGDCCLDYIDDTKCSSCICSWDYQRHLSKVQQNCSESSIGDGICNDICNNFSFDYDLFDCCLNKIRDDFCIDCICHEDDMVHKMNLCSFHRLGNERCEDECNSIMYDYDEFDCCGEIINDNYCDDCICHEDGNKHPIL